ncbi:hypothetical protein CNMCM8686_000081 [Aspergillus fumigatus]|nr:hypothetical protein CNMCM8686_000081 [Aspergillus fumigatus]
MPLSTSVEGPQKCCAKASGHSLLATRNASAGPATSSSTIPRGNTKYTGIMAARPYCASAKTSAARAMRAKRPCSTSSVASRISAGV